LPAVTYANGTAGVGATLTANANGVMAAVDGITPVAADRVLVKNQAAALQNGIYTVTSIGAVGAPFVLTRAIDADTSAKIADAKVLVDTGTANVDTEWYQSSTAPTMGTTALYWRRTQPIYGHGNPRSLWAPASGPTVAQPIMETVPRSMMLGIYTQPVAATNQYIFGGIVAPAGRTISNIGLHRADGWCAPYGVVVLAGARLGSSDDGAYGEHHERADGERRDDRAFVNPWTPIEDTPFWVCMSYVNATTAMVIYGAVCNATTTAAQFISPVMMGVNAVTPTTTVPTDGTTVMTAATAGIATSATVGMPYFWLTPVALSNFVGFTFGATGLLTNNGGDTAVSSTATGAAIGDGSASWPARTETAWTWVAWVQPAATNGFVGAQAVVSWDSSVTAAAKQFSGLMVNAGGFPQVWMRGSNGTRYTATSTTPIAAGTTNRLTGRFDGTTLSLRVNGVTVATTTPPVGMDVTQTVAPIFWSDDAGAAGFLAGTLDEVAWYQSALTDAQDLTEYQAGTATVPAAPTAVTGSSASSTSIALTWAAPFSGGDPITGYTVTPYISGVAQTPIATGSTATSYTVTSLTTGTAYTFTVKATNALGTGAQSAPTAAITPLAGSNTGYGDGSYGTGTYGVRSTGATTVTAAAGTATAGGGTSTVTVALTAASGTATAGGGTAAPRATVLAATGLATAAGGTAALTAVLVASSGAATASGGTVTPRATIVAATGLATASGGTASFTVTLTAATGLATAGGGTATATKAVNLTAATGTATAAGGTTALAVTLTASSGTATTSGTASLTATFTAASGAACRFGWHSNPATDVPCCCWCRNGRGWHRRSCVHHHRGFGCRDGLGWYRGPSGHAARIIGHRDRRRWDGNVHERQRVRHRGGCDHRAPVSLEARGDSRVHAGSWIARGTTRRTCWCLNATLGATALVTGNASDTAASFNGTTSVIYDDTTTPARSETTGWTWVAWVKPTGFGRATGSRELGRLLPQPVLRHRD
jgi:hypothetical protein